MVYRIEAFRHIKIDYAGMPLLEEPQRLGDLIAGAPAGQETAAVVRNTGSKTGAMTWSPAC
jgi:hypothetical protein